ncbi:MAG: hypothetical protein FWG03_08260 [Clostridiales bacterium]|nr:hypothetical protein [Clostridiales bacterium]
MKLNGDDVILSVGETGLSERIVKGVRLIEKKTAPGSFGAVLLEIIGYPSCYLENQSFFSLPRPTVPIRSMAFLCSISAGNNIAAMQKCGYSFVAAFVMPENCWDNYFIPREAAGKALMEKYAGNQTVAAYLEDDKYEAELYSKYKQQYGYVFYIGKKI